jgi:hypothetical protein
MRNAEDDEIPVMEPDWDLNLIVDYLEVQGESFVLLKRATKEHNVQEAIDRAAGRRQSGCAM